MRNNESTFDRSRRPDPGAISDFSLLDASKLERGRLTNGMNLLLYRYKKLPVVQINCTFRTGTYDDPADKAGLANLFAEMLDEGTLKRNALEIADSFEYLGTQFSTWASKDGIGTGMLTLREHLPASLDLFADIMLDPSFPENELQRVKQNILTAILQETDQPNSVATNVFTRSVYGTGHPYGFPIHGMRETVEPLSVADLREKYETLFKPGAASIVVVGDIPFGELSGMLERAFADWKGDRVEAGALPDMPERSGSSIRIVNRPGAVQSQIRIGHRGIERTHRDYFPVLVMNQILGGQFTSRINLNLREDKGYTYGASSVWDARKYGGHFMTTGGFQGEFTDRAVAELMKELEHIGKEIRADELNAAKDGLIRALPRQFETPAQIGSHLSTVELYGLPDDYYSSYVDTVQKVTIEEVLNAARSYIRPESVEIVVVGDVAAISDPLEKLGLGSPVEVDVHGDPTG
jgi:zinc protease